MDNTINNKRILEFDLARGIAIVAMIILHIPFMMDMYGGYSIYDSIASKEGILSVIAIFLHLVRKFGGAFFIFISGICTKFGKNKLDWILVPIALSLTAISYIMYNSGIEGHNILIQFGILHVLAFSKLVFRLMEKFPTWLIGVIALLVLILGYYFTGNIRGPESIWLIFGIHPVSYSCFDYQPILPQFGWYLVGAVIGRIFYKENKTVILPNRDENTLSNRFFTWVGRHSLIIYLIQLPVIYLLVKFVF